MLRLVSCVSSIRFRNSLVLVLSFPISIFLQPENPLSGNRRANGVTQPLDLVTRLPDPWRRRPPGAPTTYTLGLFQEQPHISEPAPWAGFIIIIHRRSTYDAHIFPNLRLDDLYAS